jgi:hypothetical protein
MIKRREFVVGILASLVPLPSLALGGPAQKALEDRVLARGPGVMT